MHKKLLAPLIGIVSVIISLLIIEVFARVYLPEFSDTFVIPINDVNQKYHHPLSERISEPKEDSYRILFLGDSFTQGFNGEENSFPSLVNENFKNRSASCNVQVFNLGTGSYSPSIEAVLLRDYAPKLKPNMVVLALDDSDPQDDYVYKDALVIDESGMPVSVYPRLLGVPEELDQLARKLKILRLIFGAYQYYFSASPKASDKERQVLGHIENRLGHYRAGDDEAWNAAFERTLGLVDKIREYCVRNQIQLVIVNYPYAPAVTNQYAQKWAQGFNLNSSQLLTSRFHAYVKNYATEKKIHYYNFTGFLGDLEDHNGIYREDDGHFTILGDTYLADQLTIFLNSLIPQCTSMG